MAGPTYHLTDAGGTSASDPGSGVFNTAPDDLHAFGPTTPGSVLMDANVWYLSTGSTLLFQFGVWTATINGRVTSATYDGNGNPDAGNAGIYIYNGAAGSTVTIGATGEVSGYSGGIVADVAARILNMGTVSGLGTASAAIQMALTAGSYSITNAGSIIGGTGVGSRGIDMERSGTGAAGGTHTIVNSGFLSGETAIYSAHYGSLERVTNSGFIDGLVSLGGGADVFTDFLKVKVKGKFVVKHGTVDGIIDLGDGADTLNGGNSAETVKDGAGADIYKLSGGNDTLFAAHDTGADGADYADGGAGIDTYDISLFDGTGPFKINLDKVAHGGIAASSVVVGGQTDRLFNFENVIGNSEGAIVYGNAAANHFVNTSYFTTFYGFGGNDVIEAPGNHVNLYGGDGNDVLTGGLYCYLEGGAGNDILTGDLSGTTIYGGAGADVMTRGDFQGAGTIEHLFIYKALSDSGTTAATRDRITNFSAGGTPGSSGDFIDLEAIDAVPRTKNVNDDFIFIGNNPWHHRDGELRYLYKGSQTIIEADVNGDAKADFSIALDGHKTLSATDFIGVIMLA
ncbi:MAG TPA: hypothetical protein PKA74_00750 [Bauldia sp.]|nr:hypothetical protein [Bauldia sp.]